MNSANVICRDLGYEGAISTAVFGKGSGQVLLDDVKCRGDEASIMLCPHKGLHYHNCDHSQDVGVVCSNGKCSFFICCLLSKQVFCRLYQNRNSVNEHDFVEMILLPQRDAGIITHSIFLFKQRRRKVHAVVILVWTVVNAALQNMDSLANVLVNMLVKPVKQPLVRNAASNAETNILKQAFTHNCLSCLRFWHYRHFSQRRYRQSKCIVADKALSQWWQLGGIIRLFCLL